MLLLEAEICFDKIEDNPNALPWDLNTTGIFRPAINFNDIYLSSGTIIFNKNLKKALRGETYKVSIELPLIFEDEIFERISSVVIKKGSFKMQAGSKVIGKGKILDYIYESD